MSFIDGILEALGIGGGSLQHIQGMARSVKPEEIEAMAPVFDHGSQVFNTGHGHLESAIDNVVSGWKGDAARAASTSVLDGAMKSRQSAETSSSAADNVRSYASQLRETRSQILAVQPVDTSFSHAVQASGGPVVAALNPGAVAANMAAAQIQSEQHREQAANYLSQMNGDSQQFAATQQTFFTPVPPPPGSSGIAELPDTISIHSPDSSGGGGSLPSVRGPAGGGPGTTAPPSTWTGAPVRHPYDNGGRPQTGTDPGNGPGNGGNPGNPPTGPVEVQPPPGDTTPGQGANPPGQVAPVGPPAALPDPVGSGSGIGAGTAALLGGGAAAIAAGGVAGWNRAGWAGGRGLAGAGGLADGADGPGARGAAERGFARGVGGVAEETPGRFGTGSGLGGGFDPEESALRAGRMSAAAASELAAGERGMMPPMGGSGARRSDDEELDKRPDYLVETDDVWGDGRLAAPPVLG